MAEKAFCFQVRGSSVTIQNYFVVLLLTHRINQSCFSANLMLDITVSDKSEKHEKQRGSVRLRLRERESERQKERRWW